MSYPKLYKNRQVVRFKTLSEWLKWLDAHHDTVTEGVWMMIAKKASKGRERQWGLDYKDTREGALCYGWIDSLPNKLDENFYYLKVTPRRPKSVWSKINVMLIEDYNKRGVMHPAGMKEVEAAKADGRWDKAY